MQKCDVMHHGYKTGITPQKKMTIRVLLSDSSDPLPGISGLMADLDPRRRGK